MVFGIVLALCGVAASVLAIAGAPLLLLWVVALVGLFLTLRRWVSGPGALGFAAVLVLALELGLLYLAPPLGATLPVLDVVAFTVIAVGSGVWLAVRPVALPDARGTALGAAALAGSALVALTALLAQVVPGATRLAWAMNSDAVNVMTFSRDILAAGGLVGAPTGQDTSPTPLPFGMLANAMAPGRASIADAGLAEHDVARLAGLWVLMIALSCALAGAIAVRAAAKVRLPFAIAATVIASIVGLSWYVIGVQFEYGFLASAFAVVVLLAAWLAFLEGEQQPALSLAVLLLAGTVILAVWSPLIICVAALGVVIVLTRWRALLASGPPRLAAVGVSFVILVVYVALVTLPEFLIKSSFLGANGGFPNFGPAQVLTIMVVTALVSVVGARVLGLRHPVIGALAAVVAGAAGLAFLLAQRTDAVSGWGYYPAKFAWTVTILLVVIAVGGAAAFLARLDAKKVWDVAIAVLGVALLGAMLWSPVQPTAQAPLVSILTGSVGGMSNAAADIVFENAGRENGQDVVWRSTVGDSWPNLWLLQLDVDDNHHNPVRSFAYQLTVFTPEEMCQVVDLLGSDVVIHTADPAAEADLAAVCDGRDYRVVVGAY